MSWLGLPAESNAVGRANYILLAFGLAAILIMSMIMKNLLRMQQDHKVSPVARELLSSYGARMCADPVVKIETKAGQVEAKVTVRPLAGVNEPRFAREVGEFVWRRIGVEERLGSVVVRTVDELDGHAVEHSVPPPFFMRGSAPGVGSRPSSSAASASTAAPR